ncbi:hypothetical protein GCM10010302_17720 [Streptomyces polychromogenes]|uniref:PE-PGRS family protein n=1 Tax=Streptomyces polychromogenes TaxID=67342 RepID=A0ABN0V888_9ACTN
MTDASYPTRDELARAIALEAAYEASKPRTPDQVEAVTARIWGDWVAAYPEAENRPPLISFIREVADTRSVTIEGRGDTRAFWSFRSQPEGAPRDVGHRFLAQACGESRGYQVLEDTEAGRTLDSYHLWQPEVQRALAEDLGLPVQDVRDLAPEVWKAASFRYAVESQGPVVAFAAEIGAGSVLGETEMPQLLGHRNVGKEGVRFPLPFPRHQHLPVEIDELMSDEAVRCQMRMEDYDAKDTTPEQFAAKLAAVDVPERLKEQHGAAVTRLGAAKGYEELTARTAGNEQTGPQAPEVAASELDEPAPPKPEPAAPRLGQSFIHGAAIPRTVAVPPRPAAAVASTHGVINPVLEASSKSPGVER